MRSMFLVGAGLLAVLAAPSAVVGQPPPAGTVMTDDGRVYTLTADQQTLFDAWTAEQRMTYSAWPYDYRTYYWTLTPAQTIDWWALTDQQRAQVYAMTPEARMAAWAAIDAQLAGRPPGNRSVIVSQANPRGSSAPATLYPPNPETASTP